MGGGGGSRAGKRYVWERIHNTSKELPRIIGIQRKVNGKSEGSLKVCFLIVILIERRLKVIGFLAGNLFRPLLH
jgi:hypothetical protein